MSQPTFNQLMEFANRGRRAQEEVNQLTSPWTIGQEQVMNSIASSLKRLADAHEEFVKLVSEELSEDEEDPHDEQGNRVTPS